MNQDPLISIITVVYNGANTIEQTILSVLNQTYPNIEYIIIDGKSTDGTIDIIKKYEDKIEKWVSESDKGLYDAMNKGVSKARGELIGIINSDDWYEPSAIELVVSAYKKEPKKKVFHADRYDVLPNNQKKRYPFNPSKAKFLFYAMTYNHASMFFHKDIYSQYKYNDQFKVFSDYELVLKLYLKTPEYFKYIKETYVNYRIDGISARQSLKLNLKEGSKARLNAGLNYFYVIVYKLLTTIKHYI
ncbi:glycosyltransferase family 2 protein [Corallibacter sp.]|uniref:glycosyltransferase family 2 protein n=1 Tax=Corallibacter sp. TaxID=2038084 RepID=UPI003AB123D0